MAQQLQMIKLTCTGWREVRKSLRAKRKIVLIPNMTSSQLSTMAGVENETAETVKDINAISIHVLATEKTESTNINNSNDSLRTPPEALLHTLESADGVTALPDPETSADVRKPWTFMVPNKKDIVKEEHIWNADVRARLWRLLLIWGLPSVMWLILRHERIRQDDNATTHLLSRYLGITLVAMITFYFMNLAYQLWPSINPKRPEYLFSVYTRLSTVNGWTAMRIANTQLLFPYRPIRSISEFSAISGGQANQTISNLGPVMWTGLMMMYAGIVQNHGADFTVDIADILMCIGVTGVVMIGLFELNSYDRGLIYFHKCGVTLSFCVLAAALIQGIALGGTYWVFPVTMTVIFLIAFTIWQWIARSSNASKFENEMIECVRNGDRPVKECRDELKLKINRCSLQCILFEGIAFYAVMWAVAGYFINYGNTCSRGCLYSS